VENTLIVHGLAVFIGAFLVGKEKTMNRKEILIFLLVLVAALAIRIYFVPAPGYEHDIMHYKQWGQATVEYGVHNVYEKSICEYPPVFVYILKTVCSFYKVFYPKFDEHTYLYDFLIKAPSMLADIIASLGIFIFLRRKNSFKFSLIAMSAYAFNPVIIMDSAVWGQTDAISTLIALGAIFALINNRFALSWSLIIFGMLTKLQLVVLLPLIILITLKRGGFSSLLRGLAASWCTYVIVMAPFLYFHKADLGFTRLFNTVGQYPFLSLFAFNFWWLIGQGQARWLSDTGMFLNLWTYRTLGMLIFALFYVPLLSYLYKNEKDENAVFYSATMASFAYYMLPTEMHERYIMLVFIFLLFTALKNRKLWIAYAALSFSTIFSLLYVLFSVYPFDYPHLPLFFKSVPLGIALSIINITAFLYMSSELFKRFKLKDIVITLAAGIFILSAYNYIKPVRPVYLSDLVPKAKEQQWGDLHMDRSVDNHTLTVNGFIYPKGLGTHANSSIEYILDGRYRILEGAVGIDDESRRDNKIEAWIYADNKLIYKSGIIPGWIDPRYFRLNIKGVKVIKLIISDGGDGINYDHGDWLGIKALP
jgi:Gpi18-like mannosyltransferase